MSSDPKTPDDKGIQFPNAAINLIVGTDENTSSLSETEIKQELREEGVDPDAAWAKAKKLLDASAGRLKLEQARRERLAAPQSVAAAKSPIPESRESIIEQIKRLLALEPSAAVYARKWEDGDLAALISLRDKLASTGARDLARKNAH